MKAIIEKGKTYKLITVKGAYYHCEDERGLNPYCYGIPSQRVKFIKR